MSVKLFRSTGYSSIFAPGETRVAMHPGWMIAAVSAWTGFVCNVALWRGWAQSPAGSGLARALAIGCFVAAGCALVLSLLGWRRTIKPAGTLLLLMAALAACSVWTQALPVDVTLLDRRLSGVLVPPWASLLHWQVSALLAVLGLVPAAWVWHTRIRRLSASQQLSLMVMGSVAAAALLGGSGFLLSQGWF
jgi:glucan phosphoethanolaminetransferase (alkaline phosphatase superfamily)